MADTALERIKLEQEEEKSSKDIQESRKEKQSLPEFVVKAGQLPLIPFGQSQNSQQF